MEWARPHHNCDWTKLCPLVFCKSSSNVCQAAWLLSSMVFRIGGGRETTGDQRTVLQHNGAGLAVYAALDFIANSLPPVTDQISRWCKFAFKIMMISQLSKSNFAFKWSWSIFKPRAWLLLRTLMNRMSPQCSVTAAVWAAHTPLKTQVQCYIEAIVRHNKCSQIWAIHMSSEAPS